jgi:RHS repeat-associated protein
LRRIDFNGDGNGDFPAYQYFCNWSGYCWTNALIISGKNWTSTQIGSNEGVSKVMTGDWNGDGLTDVAHNIIPGGVDAPTGPEALVTRVSNGYSTGPAITLGNTAGYDLAKAVVIDWNGDARDDLLIPSTTTNTWWVYKSDGENLTAGVDTTLSTSSAQVVFPMDINGDGLMDIGYVNGAGLFAYRLHTGNMPDLLASVTDGYGNVTALTYGTTAGAGANSCYVQDTTAPTFPVSRSIQTLITACKVTAPNGIGGTFDTNYTYYNNNRNLEGRGGLGFEKRQIVDSRNSVASTDFYSQIFPYTGGLDKKETTQTAGGTLMERTSYTFATLTGNSGYYAYKLPYISNSSLEKYEVGGTKNGTLISTTASATTMESVVVGNGTGGSDTYGRVTASTTSTTEAATANGLQAGAIYTNQTLRQNFQDSLSATDWCFDIPGQIQTITSHTLTGGAAVTRTAGQTWNIANCRLSQRVTEPGNATYQVTTDLGYDSLGNQTTTTVTGVNMAPRTATVTYSTAAPYYGRFATNRSNPLSQSVSATWEAARGLELSATDPNNLTASWLYDAFGRKTQANSPDGTSTTIARQDCSALGACTGQIKNVITTTNRTTTNTTINDSKSYLDKFDRTVEARSRTLNNTAGNDYSKVQTEFDALGRTYRSSAPCMIGSCTTPFWTTNTYDLANRITLSQTPVSATNSALRSSNFYYEGLTIRLVDALGKQTKKINNVVSQLIRTQDHDLYAIGFGYNGAGSLISVIDSQSNTLSTATYDYGINGGTQDNITTWTWGTSAVAHNIGKLQSASSTGASTYTDTWGYDSYGRVSQRNAFNTSDAGGTTYTFDYGYHSSTGLLDTLTYPVSTSSYRLKLLYGYQNGQLLNIKDFNAQATVFWAANTTNARGQHTQQTFGNGVVTNRSFDAVNAWMSTQTAGVGGGTGVQNESYLYDYVGNVTQRQNNALSLTESFCYDNLYRLDYSVLGAGCGGTQNLNVDYAANGNITNKTAVGTYDYTTPQAGCTYYANGQLHAVRKAGSTIYCYDANGNMVRRGAATNTIAWTSYNYPSQIVNSGTENISFLYGPDRQRWRTTYVNGATTETTYQIGNVWNKVITGATTDYRHNIYVGSRSIAVYSRKSTGTNTLRYVLEDYQGSVANILTSTGTSYVKENFSAFGERRNPATWSGAPTSADINLINGVTREGYTWQTALGNLGLNHMNGRVQDAVSGRFLSPDPNIPDVEFTQEYNRFSYVRSNPMTMTDPTGFFMCDGPGSLCDSNMSDDDYLCSMFGINCNDGGVGGEDEPGGAIAIGPDVPPQSPTGAGPQAPTDEPTNPCGEGSQPDIVSDDDGEPRIGCLTTLSNEGEGGGGAAAAGGFAGMAALALRLAQVAQMRREYVVAVRALAEKVTSMREAGYDAEIIARVLHRDRRVLGQWYKSVTPPDFLKTILQRNLEKYGDELGPTIEWLRAQGKTWEEIIESASRAGGADLGL